MGGLTPELGLFDNNGDVPNLLCSIPTSFQGFNGVLVGERGDEVDAHVKGLSPVLCRLNHSSHILVAHWALPYQKQISSLDGTCVVLDDDGFRTVAAPDIGKEFLPEFCRYGPPQFRSRIGEVRNGLNGLRCGC